MCSRAHIYTVPNNITPVCRKPDPIRIKIRIQVKQTSDQKLIIGRGQGIALKEAGRGVTTTTPHLLQHRQNQTTITPTRETNTRVTFIFMLTKPVYHGTSLQRARSILIQMHTCITYYVSAVHHSRSSGTDIFIPCVHLKHGWSIVPRRCAVGPAAVDEGRSFCYIVS